MTLADLLGLADHHSTPASGQSGLRHGLGGPGNLCGPWLARLEHCCLHDHASVGIPKCRTWCWRSDKLKIRQFTFNALFARHSVLLVLVCHAGMPRWKLHDSSKLMQKCAASYHCSATALSIAHDCMLTLPYALWASGTCVFSTDSTCRQQYTWQTCHRKGQHASHKACFGLTLQIV